MSKEIDAEIERLYGAGKYDEAISLAERAWATVEQALGPDHLDVATHLNNLAVLYYTKSDYAKAEPLHQRALMIREKALGPDHPLVANSLNNLALLYSDKGDYTKSEPLYQRSLAIREKAGGPNHPDVATALNNLAELYRVKGGYAKATALYQRVLAIDEKTLGPNHPDVALSLNNLAELYRVTGDYAEAEALHQRALTIREKVLGPAHPDVAQSLNNLALLYDNKGDYARAEPLLQCALTIHEQVFGPNHPNVAQSLNNLALLYYTKGDYAKAERPYQRALAIVEQAFGPNHLAVAQSLNNLALLYYTKGDYAKAEPLLERALTIHEQELGPDHSAVATSLNNLAELYREEGDYEDAEPFYLRALAIFEQSLGPDHPDVALSLNSLAKLYHVEGDYAKAEPLYQRALMIREKTLGPDHPEVATNLNDLAMLYYTNGDYAKAEPLHQRALMIREKALGPDHPAVVQSLNNLAALYEAKGNVRQALALCLRATDISERNITLNLATGSERQKLRYLAVFSDETDRTVSLHIHSAPNDLAARRLALTTILRRKGRVLDATADSIGALRRRLDPQDEVLLDQFINTRSRLATRVRGGPGKIGFAEYRAEIKQLEEQAEQLEAQISARSAEFRTQSAPVTLESVQATIPADAALVEFVSYYPYNAKEDRFESRSYAAYVLSNQGEPQWVNLGEATEIDRLVTDLRAVLRQEYNKPLSDIELEVQPKARLLDQKVMQPVRKLLGDKRKLLVSPDGALNLIPFAALVDEQSRYLIEAYSLTYLTTGRDLLHLQTKLEHKQGVTVFADPDFDYQATGCKAHNLEPPDVENDAMPTSSRVYFSQLFGTAEEAQSLQTIFPDAVVWMQQQATKTELKQVNAPAILHIATHGFFLDDLVISAAEVRSLDLFIRTNQPGEIAAPEFHVEDPLLRSGLAFAGANLHRTDDDNGILTAKEAAGLNLWGTKLVVLSACDTGVGEVQNGEGVYGLRRALVLAGSESQVVSLWPVSDAGTRDLMIDYYKGLQAGGGRSEALRQVQLRMLKSDNCKHPHYWASFIQSGEWANLDGKR